jgi:hypothetical protein
MDAADGLTPVVQLMSMLRQTVENLQLQKDTEADNNNVQKTQAQAQDNAAPVEEAVPSPVLATIATVAEEQVGRSATEREAGSSSDARPAPNSLPTTT